MLTNIVCGSTLLNQPWKVEKDEYGNRFLTHDEFNQRIRIDKNLDMPEELEVVWNSSFGTSYKLPEQIHWVNNNRTMNPMIQVSDREPEVCSNQILYLTFASKYNIMNYTCDHRILLTYHKAGLYQGCAIVMTPKELKEKPEVITVTVYDRKVKDSQKGREYIQFIVTYDADKGVFNVEKKTVKDKESIEAMKATLEKYKLKFMGFKVRTVPRHQLTRTFITNEKSLKEAQDASSMIKSRQIIVIPDDVLNDEEKLSEFLNKQEFLKNKIRAVTLVNVNLPLNIVREQRFLYVFNWDAKNKVLSCVKSN